MQEGNSVQIGEPDGHRSTAGLSDLFFQLLSPNPTACDSSRQRQTAQAMGSIPTRLQHRSTLTAPCCTATAVGHRTGSGPSCSLKTSSLLKTHSCANKRRVVWWRGGCRMLWLECSSALVQLKDPPAVGLQGAGLFFILLPPDRQS